MKPFIILSFFLLTVVSSSATGVIKCSSDKVAKEWGKLSEKRRAELSDKILSSGISSTGSIELKKIYTLTHDEEIGKKGVRIGLLVQEDLFGGRLFWIQLVNLDTGRIRMLYQTGRATPKRSGAEQGETGKPATAVEPKAEIKKKAKPESKGRFK